MKRDRIIFIACILFAFLIWVPQKLSKRYNRHIPISVTVDAPADREFVSNEIVQLPVDISGHGNHLILLDRRMTTDTIVLPWQGTDMNQSYLGSEILTALRSQHKVPDDVTLTTEIHQLSFEFDSLDVRRLPVTPHFNLEFKAGFGPSSPIVLTPDSVDISGHSERLQNIHEVSTDSFDVLEIDENLAKSIALVVDSSGFLKYSSESVTMSVEVERLIEKELIIPIRHLADEESNRVLFPDHVNLRLSVPASLYQEVTPEVVLLSLLPGSRQSMIVEIDSLPDFCQYIMHTPKVVRYYRE